MQVDFRALGRGNLDSGQGLLLPTVLLLLFMSIVEKRVAKPHQSPQIRTRTRTRIAVQ